ncbi:MAG: glycosyltransferase [Elusimicrobia bacterium]|nr:glycosyltransferase [Elusimicrobiota bacterium]
MTRETPPPVSIIVLCHGRWRLARRCLESLRRTTDPRLYELLVFDNASTDRTLAGLRRLARGWPQLRVFHNPRNLPFAEGVNRGMRRARGEFFLWLNNDTVLSPGWLEGLLKAAGSRRDAAGSGPMTGSAAPPGQLCRPFASERRSRVEEAPFLGGFCFLVKRAAVERAGFLDERFVWGWEDMDYCLRLRQAGYRLILARGVFVRHAGSRTISSMAQDERERSDLRNRGLILRKWAESEPWGDDLRELFRKCPAAWVRPVPTVSIVVFCRGGRALACLESVRRRCGRAEIEVLAVDSGEDSRLTRRLEELAASWDELKVLGPWGPLSPAQALNRAVAQAQGDFAAVLDEQAVVGPGWLAGLLGAAREQTEVGAARPKAPRGGWLLILRRIFARVGGFDERFAGPFCADDLCLRIVQAGYGLVELSEAGLLRAPRRARWEGVPAADQSLVERKWLSPEWGGAGFQERFWKGTLPARKLRPRVSIVVICRGGWARARACLESVRRCAGGTPYEALAAVLGPDRDAQRGLGAMALEWPELRVVGYWEPVSYPHAVNLALRSAQGEHLIVLGDEALASPGWVEGLVEAAGNGGAAGVVAPVYEGSRLPWQTGGGTSQGAGSSRPVHYVRDCCLLVPRAAFLSIGEFDDRFEGRLGAEDYCLRAKQRGVPRPDRVKGAPAPAAAMAPGGGARRRPGIGGARRGPRPREMGRTPSAAAGAPAMIRTLHRAVLRTRGLPGLNALYRGVYAGAVAGSARALHALPGIRSVYLHRGLTRDGWEPGVSDIDLVLLCEDGRQDADVFLRDLGARLAALRRPFPMLGDVWLGSGEELRNYLRWGGLRAWEDAPDWRLVRGASVETPACAESDSKRRWLDPWVWIFVNHMEICRRLFSPAPCLPEKRDADLRKLYLDVRRYSDFILAPDGSAKAPATRAQLKEAAREAARTPPRALWLESSLRLARASRAVLAAAASPARAEAAFPAPPARDRERLERLLAGSRARQAVFDPPYHTYLLLDEGASERDYLRAARSLLDHPQPCVPMVLEPSAWTLALQSSYLGAPLGWLGGEGERGQDRPPAPFDGWGACALGDLAGRLPLLSARLRWETAAESASWMALWWRALWIGPRWPNRFVLYHLYTRAMGLRLILDGAPGGPFCDWEIQSACLSARSQTQRRPLSRARALLLCETAGTLESCARGELEPGHLRALAGLMRGLQPALSAS